MFRVKAYKEDTVKDGKEWSIRTVGYASYVAINAVDSHDGEYIATIAIIDENGIELAEDLNLALTNRGYEDESVSFDGYGRIELVGQDR